MQRYAKDEQAQRVQLLIIPVIVTFVAFTGIAVTPASIALYGDVLWDPLRLIDRWDNRAAAFFAALSFMLATLGDNVSANSLSAANNMTVLFPRYINIRRGQMICAVLGGWALCPWEILASAQGFLSFMNGYNVFLGPFSGIMVADVSICALYVPSAVWSLTGLAARSTGSSTRARLTCLRCTVLMDDTDTDTEP